MRVSTKGIRGKTVGGTDREAPGGPRSRKPGVMAQPGRPHAGLFPVPFPGPRRGQAPMVAHIIPSFGIFVEVTRFNGHWVNTFLFPF